MLPLDNTHVLSGGNTVWLVPTFAYYMHACPRCILFGLLVHKKTIHDAILFWYSDYADYPDFDFYEKKKKPEFYEKKSWCSSYSSNLVYLSNLLTHQTVRPKLSIHIIIEDFARIAHADNTWSEIINLNIIIHVYRLYNCEKVADGLRRNNEKNFAKILQYIHFWINLYFMWAIQWDRRRSLLRRCRHAPPRTNKRCHASPRAMSSRPTKTSSPWRRTMPIQSWVRTLMGFSSSSTHRGATTVHFPFLCEHSLVRIVEELCLVSWPFVWES